MRDRTQLLKSLRHKKFPMRAGKQNIPLPEPPGSEKPPVPVPPTEDPPPPIKDPPAPINKAPIDEGPKGPKEIVARPRSGIGGQGAGIGRAVPQTAIRPSAWKAREG